MSHEINLKEYLSNFIQNNNIEDTNIQLPDVAIDPAKIRVIMINEVPPADPKDWFYSNAKEPGYMRTTLMLFQDAEVFVKNINDIISLGIYVTTAVKSPKDGYMVDTALLKKHLPVLETELDLFPNLKAIMLMGDVAKKSINMIAKARTKKNVIPSESTYKIRKNEYYWGNIRVFPSYIMTGGNILIEKSKREMVSDDIGHMMEYLKKLD